MYCHNNLSGIGPNMLTVLKILLTSPFQWLRRNIVLETETDFKKLPCIEKYSEALFFIIILSI
jgi:hypothetical protein